MKNKVLPFTCLKLHFEGETFAPVPIDTYYQLQSVDSVLVGAAGNAYEFKTAENALIWLDTNLIKASKNQTTKQEHIDKLIIKNSITPRDYLQTEIDVLESRNLGEWSIYFNDEVLADEFGIIAKGDKGDKGDDGESGITWTYPLNAVLISADNLNPFEWLGYGTWQSFGAGRVLVGQDDAQTEFNALGETGGEKTHTLTAAQMPSHTHTQNAHNHAQNAHNHAQDPHAHNVNRWSTGINQVTNIGQSANNATPAASGLPPVTSTTATNQAATATNQAATATNQNTGGGEAHNNLQPYITVKFWIRTA